MQIIKELNALCSKGGFKLSISISHSVLMSIWEKSRATSHHPQTRRGVLSVVSSLYYPMESLAPFNLAAKLLPHKLWGRHWGWDSLSAMVLLVGGPPESIRVDRCIKTHDFKKPDKAHHHVSDSSLDGYGTVSYVRLEKINASHIDFIMSRSS